MPPSCDPLLNGVGCYFHDQYVSAVQELLNGPFSAEQVQQNINTWSKQIESSVQEAYELNAYQLSPEKWNEGIVDLYLRTKMLREQTLQ